MHAYTSTTWLQDHTDNQSQAWLRLYNKLENRIKIPPKQTSADYNTSTKAASWALLLNKPKV